MRIALVTGGSRGIGAATVKKFAESGYTVILNYNKSEVAAEALKRKLLSSGCDVHLYRADVSDVKQVDDMFAWVKKLFKRLDVLVNNAGVSSYALCTDVSEEKYDRVMNVNAKGTFFCCSCYAKYFLERGSGSIVNVSSIWGVEGASCESVYSMSKHAVVGLTSSLAKEFSESGIRINCVCPSIVKTDMCSHLTDEDIRSFCEENGVSEYSAEQVADDIFRLATSNNTGIILRQR